MMSLTVIIYALHLDTIYVGVVTEAWAWARMLCKLFQVVTDMHYYRFLQAL